MKAVMVKPYRYSHDGINIHDLNEGDVVGGEVAKKLIKSGVAEESNTDDPIIFDDNGRIEFESEVMTQEQAEELLSLTLDQIKVKQGELNAINQAIAEAQENLDAILSGNEGAVEAGGLDSNGTPWDERIHSSSKTKTNDGIWKRRKGVSDELFDEVMLELSGYSGDDNTQTEETLG
jgi:hypothetical protein